MQFALNSQLKVYNSVVFSKFRMCNHHHIPSLEHLHHPKKETLKTSLVGHFHCRGTGLIPGQGTKGLPWGSAGKESACNVGDLGSIPGLGRSPGEGKGYPLQYSGLENSMDSVVHGVAKSQTRLSNFHLTLHSRSQGTKISHLRGMAKNRTPCTRWQFALFPPNLPAPNNHHCTCCLYRFAYSGYFI